MFNYYDLFTRDKDYAGEAEYFSRFLKGRSLLDLGCGDGRHGVCFQLLGYHVIGVEREPTLALFNTAFPTVVSDISDFSVEEEFENITALFHVVNYQVSDNALISVFDKAAQALTPQGRFIFDCWYKPAVLHIGPSQRTKTVDGITRTSFPTTRPDSLIEVRFRFEPEGCEELHVMRPLDEKDIARFAPQFKIIHSEEFMTGKPLSKETWCALFVLQRGI
jgi:SAM-dependent methyltransferase